MKVRDIIGFSEWVPPRDDRAKVGVSVLIPNYNRGRNGMFEAAIKSILRQTYDDFELIIIEDGSTDNSLDIVRRYVDEDERVGLINHPRNVGLPAISVYEGIRRARGEFLSFCFNDNEFFPNALENLVAAGRANLHKVVFGHVEFHMKGDRPGELIVQTRFGANALPQGYLLSHNYLAQPSSIMSRELFEDIGQIDPHVAITRLNDWDFWRRCAAQYEFKHVDISVCLEKGPKLRDSLGSSHLMNLWLCEEWMRIPRNEVLQTSRIEDYDVLAVPETLSRTGREGLREISQRFRKKFWWRDVESGDRPSSLFIPSRPASQEFTIGDGQILVVTSDHTASRSFYFDNVPGILAQRLRVLDYGTWRGRPEEMVGAAAVIFCRSLTVFSDWIEYARKAGIPHYWFTDDNHYALWAENPSTQEHGEEFDIGTHREILKSFKGILVSTDALKSWLVDNYMHQNVIAYPPIQLPPGFEMRRLSALPTLFSTGRRELLRIGIFGGGHRIESFKNVVMPAINSLAEDHSVELYLVGAELPDVAIGPNVKVHLLPRELTYWVALGRLAALDLDVLIHPPTSLTGNLNFKTANALINAATLGTVLLAPDQPPYDHLRSEEIAIICDNTSDGWYFGLKTALLALEQGVMVKRLKEYVEDKYGGEENVQALTAILLENDAPGFAIREQRFVAMKDLAIRRVRAGGLPSQYSELNTLVETSHQVGQKIRNAGNFSRLNFLRNAANWPPNVEPMTVAQCNELFDVRDCFGDQVQPMLHSAVLVQTFLQQVGHVVGSISSFIHSLGISKDFWQVNFGADLRRRYEDIPIASDEGVAVGVLVCIRTHPGVAGKIVLALHDASGTELSANVRDLRTITYMVPYLFAFTEPVALRRDKRYYLRIYLEEASDSVQLMEMLGTSPYVKGPGERKVYYAMVYDAPSMKSNTDSGEDLDLSVGFTVSKQDRK